MNPVPPALELAHIHKRYGAIEANSDVSIKIARGEIHGLVGENGAGKSTLVSILNGLARADRGDILIDGRRVAINSPRAAIAHGIGMVHQHFMLVDTMNAVDNVMLGVEGDALLTRGRETTRRKLAALARDYGLVVDPDARVGDLPVGARQRVEILKALARDARILALDEPTAVLTPGEAAELFRLLRRLRDGGASILFITHKLGEALALTDRISVLRRGEKVAEFETARTNAAELAAAMIGHELSPRPAKSPRAAGRSLIEASGLRWRGADGRARLDGVSLALHEGEIVGVAGVAGNGQTELIEILAGMRRPDDGTISVDGVDLNTRDLDPSAMRERGVAHVPEDRLKNGLVAGFNAADNAILGRQHESMFGRGLLHPRAIEADCRAKMERWDIRPPDPRLAIEKFSGGAQQKLVLAREVERDPKILLVGQPTRGVDIGAIEAIHRRLLSLRDAGKAVLLVSVEIDEIMALSDRILVMFGGRIVGERRPKATSLAEIGLLMAGASARAA